MIKKLAIVLLVALLSSCASFSLTDSTPAQKVFAATQVYNAALSAAVAYKKLPSCAQAQKPILCSDAAVVATLQKADNVAFEALKSAQTVVRSTGASTSALSTAVAWATEAASAFSKITTALKGT